MRAERVFGWLGLLGLLGRVRVGSRKIPNRDEALRRRDAITESREKGQGMRFQRSTLRSEMLETIDCKEREESDGSDGGDGESGEIADV